MKAPLFSPEEYTEQFSSSEEFLNKYPEYHSLDELLLENEELRILVTKLKDRFCGCGNCMFKDKDCSFLLKGTESYCPEYKLENEETLDIYEE